MGDFNPYGPPNRKKFGAEIWAAFFFGCIVGAVCLSLYWQVSAHLAAEHAQEILQQLHVKPSK